ncbi:MAG: hypothetical protein OQK55_09560 [Thermoanaerobaculales bacterium]|nr:hypothetical protein [Thermoanaerobaculales bacterium]
MGADTTHTSDLVTVDMTKKRVYLHFRGSLTKAHAEKLREAYRSAITQVGPGYAAVSIFEDFMPGTADVQEVISSMIKMADEGGCRAAARVGQGGVFGQMQLGRLQRAVQAGYSVHDCETVAEADTYLDGI